MKELFSAYAKAFPEIEGALKDSINPHFKNKYADLSSVTNAIKPALAKYGLSFVQISHIADGGVCVETVILHSSGESLSCGMFFAPATKQDAQGYGSAFTYARRYSLSALLGLAADDDGLDTGTLARALGGGRRAQVLATLAAVPAPHTTSGSSALATTRAGRSLNTRRHAAATADQNPRAPSTPSASAISAGSMPAMPAVIQ